MEKTKEKGLNIGVRSFVTSIAVIFLLMVAAFVLTAVIPSGSYARVEDPNGNVIIDTEKGYTPVDGGIPFWKWLLSPVLVLGASGGGTLIAVIAFLIVIGGVFNSLDRCGLMKYMLDRVVCRFGAVKYRLMAVIILFFMMLGAMIGSFEECVPLVPIVVALALNLGFDALTGIGMSLLAVGCGFASGVCNPFTVGVAQQLAGLPMFSGVLMRVLAFVLIYVLLFSFIYFYAKKIERPIDGKNDVKNSVYSPKMNKALICFVCIMAVGIALVVSSGFIKALQDYTMIIVAVMFLVSGLVAVPVSGTKGSELAKSFFSGIVSIFPAVIMILMASSIKYTLEEAAVLDTVLHYAVGFAQDMPRWTVILFIYFIVLVMNFFIPSGSAKAFMLIPIIVPLAQVFGISAQLCILAFAFGDGFSNVFYPTNPALLISLGLTDISYGRWFKWSWKFQALNLLITAFLLLFGLSVGY